MNMYNGEYVSGIDGDGNLVILSGEVSQSDLMVGNGFPLPFLKDAVYTGKFNGHFNKILGGKPYKSSAELKHIWYKVIGDASNIVHKNDWKSWGFHA